MLSKPHQPGNTDPNCHMTWVENWPAVARRGNLCHSGIFEGRFSDFRHGRVCEHLGVILGPHIVWTLPVEWHRWFGNGASILHVWLNHLFTDCTLHFSCTYSKKNILTHNLSLLSCLLLCYLVNILGLFQIVDDRKWEINVGMKQRSPVRCWGVRSFRPHLGHKGIPELPL